MRKILASLSIAALITLVFTLNTTSANADEQRCDYGVGNPIKNSSGFIGGSTSWATCTVGHSVQVGLQVNTPSSGWQPVPDSFHYTVSCSSACRIEQVPNAVWCPNNNARQYRVVMWHTVPGYIGTHRHDGFPATKNCSGFY